MAYEDKDTRTVEALEKIKAILREYDLWTAMIVVSPERAHWLYHFDPSWSCLAFNQGTGEVRVRAKRADFVTAEQHKYVITKTAGAILATRDMSAQMFQDIAGLHAEVEKQFSVVNSYSDVEVKGKTDA